MTVKRIIEQRKLTSLFHFTTIENYISILERKFIYSRAKVEELCLIDDGFYTGDYVDSMDQQRLDGLKDYINLSLSRPNWYLLKQYKSRPELENFDWCILEIDITPILNNCTLYSVCNAASSTAKSYGVVGGGKGLGALFQNEVRTPRKTYTRDAIPPHFTTDIQAEVLIRDKISVEYIRYAYLQSEDLFNQYQSAFKLMGLSPSRFKVNEHIFNSPILR